MGAHRQTFGRAGGPHPARHLRARAAVDLLDLRLPRAVRAAARAGRRRLRDRQGRRPHRQHGPHRPRRPDRAADRRRARLAAHPRLAAIQPPDAPLSRGLEVHPWGAGDDLEIWIDRRYVPAGYGWSFPAGGRAARRRRLVRPALPRQGHRRCCWPRTSSATRSATRATGSRTSCATATEDGIFFVGDSAGHCLPLTAEGIRTALYFGIACGRELRAVVEGAPDARAGAGALPRLQRRARVEVRLDAARAAPGPARAAARCWRRRCAAMSTRRFVDWSFGHYLDDRAAGVRAGGAAAGARAGGSSRRAWRPEQENGCRPEPIRAALLARVVDEREYEEIAAEWSAPSNSCASACTAASRGCVRG